MAYIRHIPPAVADGRLAQVYKEIRDGVPRVPNLMQVFSLRPETMEGVYHSWLALMWAGRVQRQTKELMAVVVSGAARCEYCVDSHMVFAQAAGMASDKCFEVERLLDDATSLEERERLAVRYAAKVTAEPRGVQAGDRMMLARGWPSIEERVEILATISALNAVSRVANTLGVALEIPATVRRYAAGRRGAIAMLSRLTAVSVDLGERSISASPPERNREAMRELFCEQLGFGQVPPGFELLEVCPEAFDGQLRIMKKSVAVLPRDRWMRLGLIVGRLTGCDYFATHCAQWLTSRGEDPADVIAASEGSPSRLPDAETCCLRFTRDLTLHSHTMGEDRVHELRRHGLSDGAVLDVAFVGGVFNGMTRLVLGLAPF